MKLEIPRLEEGLVKSSDLRIMKLYSQNTRRPTKYYEPIG